MSYFSRLMAYGQTDAGLPSTIIPGTTTTTVLPSSLVIHAGNSVTGTALNQVLLQGTTTNNAHAIKTRHNPGGASDNAIDLFIWQYGTDSATTVGSRQALTIAQTGVGINQPYPTSALQVGGTITATGNIVAGGGLIGAGMTITGLSSLNSTVIGGSLSVTASSSTTALNINGNSVFTGSILLNGTLTQTATVTFYASWLPASPSGSSNFSIPANGYAIPASFWALNGSPYSNLSSSIMASNGYVSIPAAGVYTINYCLQLAVAAGTNITTWIQVATGTSPYFTNSTRLANYQINSSTLSGQLCAGVFTGYFATGDTFFVWVFLGGNSGNLSGGGIVNYLTLSGKSV